MRTKPDGMLVEADHLVAANKELGQIGQEKFLVDLASREPALAAFVQDRMAAIAGKLSLSGAPSPLVKGVHDEALHLVLTCLDALRRGHYDLWQGTIVGTHLEKLQAAAKPPRRKRRRSSENNEPDKPAE